MRRFLYLFFSLFIICGGGAFTAKAEVAVEPILERTSVERYYFERPHTQILFSAEHLGFSVSNGRFTDFEGELVLDRNDLASSFVSVVIKADSLYMGNEAWETHLKSADFLDQANYPEITIKSDSVELVDENTANVNGLLSMHGVDKPVTLKVHHNKSAIHPFSGQYIAGFSAETTLKRSDFGMTYGLPLLSDAVTIRIEVEAIPVEEPADDDKNNEAVDK
jgi:polyisoprenoid-binding protein YceI